MKMHFLSFLVAVASAAVFGAPSACFSIDNVFTDHMVVQRGKPIRFSGSADPDTSVTCSFKWKELKVKAGADGRWSVEFPASEAGGPYSLHVATDRSTHVVLDDILIGDVWVCSGQSNMEMPIWGNNQYYRRLDGKEFAASFKDKKIRLLQVPKAVGIGGPFNELSGRPSWKVADNPAAIEEFSFTGFSFGMALREASPEIPIGLVNASWGGTLIEPWIPFSAYEGAGDKYGEVVDAIGPCLNGNLDARSYAEKAKEQAEKRRVVLLEWVNRFKDSAPEASAKALAEWGKVGLDTSDWKKVTPATAQGLSEPGIAWYRLGFDLPTEWVGKRLVFHADYVNDADETFLDGVKIGATGPETMLTGYWAARRDYEFTVATAGNHVIAIRAQDHFGTGGIGAQLQIVEPDSGKTIVFKDMLEKVEFRADYGKLGERPPVPSSGGDIRANCQTWTALYNTMVHPLTAMNVKGVIWYQGCSNADAYRRYPDLQRLQIDAWRKAFRDENLPFVITQLSAYKTHKPEQTLTTDEWRESLPSDFGFAPMRDAQMDAVTNYPYAGIACTIDIGNKYDIHPKDKVEVGRRLAHEAQRLAYGNAEAVPGPTVASVKLEGSAVRVSFNNVGKGLYAKGGAISENLFALVDEEGSSVWADAKLESDGTILVSSPSVTKPVAVRYAYTAFPHEPNVYRSGDNIPVYPFSRSVQ